MLLDRREREREREVVTTVLVLLLVLVLVAAVGVVCWRKLLLAHGGEPIPQNMHMCMIHIHTILTKLILTRK